MFFYNNPIISVINEYTFRSNISSGGLRDMTLKLPMTKFNTTVKKVLSDFSKQIITLMVVDLR